MTNKYKPHVLVLPEDDANRQIANGFILNGKIKSRAIQILPIADGWTKLIAKFEQEHINALRDYPERQMVLLIDFDNHLDRLARIQAKIPSDIANRVFVLGVLSEPERLKASLNHQGFEAIGISLSQDCENNSQIVWGHALLRHNITELIRLVEYVKPILFDS